MISRSLERGCGKRVAFFGAASVLPEESLPKSLMLFRCPRGLIARWRPTSLRQVDSALCPDAKVQHTEAISRTSVSIQLYLPGYA
jgi:hypothetical protein